jgi:hypothetical protein
VALRTGTVHASFPFRGRSAFENRQPATGCTNLPTSKHLSIGAIQLQLAWKVVVVATGNQCLRSLIEPFGKLRLSFACQLLQSLTKASLVLYPSRLLFVTRRIVLLKQVFAKVTRKIAPHRVNVISVVLRIVKLDQK